MTCFVQTPGGRENSNHRVAHKDGEVSKGAKPAPSAEDALDASSNGVQDPAPAGDNEPVSLSIHIIPSEPSKCSMLRSALSCREVTVHPQQETPCLGAIREICSHLLSDIGRSQSRN